MCVELEKMVNEELKRNPRILTIDIETSPFIAYSWANPGKWQTNLIEIIEPSKILGFSAKWLEGKQTTKGLIDYKGYKPGVVDDSKIIKDIFKFVDEADFIIGQNNKDFDMRFINSRFLAHNLQPPSPYKIIDTKIEAKKALKLPSHALDDMSNYFEIGGKLEHEGFDLWKKCIAGDKKAWAKMKKYNAHDVKLTETLYLRLRPYMKTHPNTGIYTLSDKESCPKCSSDHVQARGYQRNSTTIYQRYQCQSCSSWYRGTKSVKLEKKPGMTI